MLKDIFNECRPGNKEIFKETPQDVYWYRVSKWLSLLDLNCVKNLT